MARMDFGHFCLLIATLLMKYPGRCSQIRFENAGYDNLLVSISPQVNPNQSESIISSIKDMIEKASPILYTATFECAFFRTVHILIPQSWENMEANVSTWETFQGADVRVAPPNAAHGDGPYTWQAGGCGDPGEYIHLTPNYLTSIDEPANLARYGSPGKMFVHEWSHYRYGVFDEYGGSGTGYSLFYNDRGDILPNICQDKGLFYDTIDISDNGACKVNSSTGLYDDNCRYTFPAAFQPRTSLMSIPYLNSVVHFCRDDQNNRHNSDALNEHNTKCGRRSVWSIIRNGSDFSSMACLPSTSSTAPLNYRTEFRIVRSNSTRFVLVADVSGSMIQHNRIDKLRESVQNWIKNDIPAGSQLGMVQFSAKADRVCDMTTVSDTESRESLIERIPTRLFSATCIGCGLELAVEMLAEAGPGASIILLVTDGKNSPKYRDIPDVLPDIIKAHIRVITIALGSDADSRIEHLADLTDGKSYFVHDNDASDALGDAFLGALTYQSDDVGNWRVKVFERSLPADGRLPSFEGSFNVDEYAGGELRFSIFNLNDYTNVEAVVLTSPSGQVFADRDVEGSVVFVSVNQTEEGKWNYEFRLREKQSTDLLITVTAQTLPGAAAPITTECYVKNGAAIGNATAEPIRVHAQVWKGNNPIVGATVKALITKPNNEVEVIDLLDNGVLADATAKDGLYSRFYTNATERGRYSLKCQVEHDGSAKIHAGFIGSAVPVSNDQGAASTGSRRLSSEDDATLSDFSRIVSGGSFKVDEPISNLDAYPPSQVTDLSATLIQGHFAGGGVTIELSWTAPGDELDSGKVAFYVLKYSNNANDLFDDNFNEASSIANKEIEEASLNLMSAGLKQTVSFPLTDRFLVMERRFYVALQAVDKASKSSPVSNLASWYLPRIENRTDSDSIGRQPEDGQDGNSAIGLASILLIVLTGSLLLSLMVRRVRGHFSEPPSYRYVPSTHTVQPC